MTKRSCFLLVVLDLKSTMLVLTAVFLFPHGTHRSTRLTSYPCLGFWVLGLPADCTDCPAQVIDGGWVQDAFQRGLRQPVLVLPSPSTVLTAFLRPRCHSDRPATVLREQLRFQSPVFRQFLCIWTSSLEFTSPFHCIQVQAGTWSSQPDLGLAAL